MTLADTGSSESPIKKITSVQDNFGLTKTEFEAYVERLRNGDESLFTKIFGAHFYDSVAYLQRKFKTNHDIAYDTCMTTMLEFRKKILDNKIHYGNLRYLYTRMAMNNYIDDIKLSNKRQLAIDVFSDHFGIESIDKQQFFDLLESAVEQQDVKAKSFIHEMFYNNKSIGKMAKESDVSNVTMRKRKQRIIDKLRSTFFELLKSD